MTPLDPAASAGGDLIEAHMSAQQFRQQDFKAGEALLLRPRVARVFVA